MKKQTNFALSFALVFTLLFLPGVVFAQGEGEAASPPTQIMLKDGLKASDPSQLQAEETLMAKVEYDMPYPGILPDHPLYFLKQLRDNILQMLIVDPIHKIEFYVLQADKKIMMGTLLLDKGKGEMGADYVSKAEQALAQAIDGVLALNAQGKEMPGYVVEKIQKATAKHRELLTDLVARASEAQKESLSGALATVEKLEQDLAKIK